MFPGLSRYISTSAFQEAVTYPDHVRRGHVLARRGMESQHSRCGQLPGGQPYIDVHSTACPDRDIGGQIGPPPRAYVTNNGVNTVSAINTPWSNQFRLARVLSVLLRLRTASST